MKAVVLLFLVMALNLFPNQLPVPSNQWEQHKEGVALAVSSATQVKHVLSIHTIQVIIKNTSTTPLCFVGVDAANEEFEIYYQNEQGMDVPLRDYVRNFAARAPPIEIKSGEALTREVELTSGEHGLIKGDKVKCRISIYGEVSKRHFSIESSPKVLVHE
jgi:hypothetical protein